MIQIYRKLSCRYLRKHVLNDLIHMHNEILPLVHAQRYKNNMKNDEAVEHMIKDYISTYNVIHLQ